MEKSISHIWVEPIPGHRRVTIRDLSLPNGNREKAMRRQNSGGCWEVRNMMQMFEWQQSSDIRYLN